MNVLYSYVCPRCMSPAIDKPSVLSVSGQYHCRTCDWRGADAYAVPTKSEFNSEQDLVTAFTRELVETFAKSSALPLGRVLVRWGLVPVSAEGVPSQQELAAFLKEMARAMAHAVLVRQERKESCERHKVS